MFKTVLFTFVHSLLFTIVLVFSVTSACEQLNFSRQLENNSIAFNYQWNDTQHNKQSIAFSLNKSEVFNQFREFKAYKANLAEGYINRKIKDTISKNPLPGVQVFFKRRSGSISVTLKGRDKQKVDAAQVKLKQLEHTYFNEYLQKNYYQQFLMPGNKQGIKPDHIRIAHESVDDFKAIKPLILEKVSIRNIRRASNYVLNFVQSIPYSTLQSRATSAGSGFNTPLRLLYENQGDCDSKVTLSAAILRSLMPRIKMIFVFIDQHALLGINVPALAGETTITQDNITYVLAEPTGPALLPLGKLSQRSEQAILNNLYTAQYFGEQQN